MKITILSVLALLLFSGCGKILLPYEEAPLCNIGIGQGYCGSVSNVYDKTTEDEEYEYEY